MLNKATKVFDRLAVLTIAVYCLSLLLLSLFLTLGASHSRKLLFFPVTGVNTYYFGYSASSYTLS